MSPGPDDPPGPIDPGPVDPPGPPDKPGPGPKPDPDPEADLSGDGYTVVLTTSVMELAECRMCMALVQNLRGQRNQHTATHRADRLARLRLW